MNTELIPVSTDAVSLAPFAPRVSDYVQASRAESTLRGYRCDWQSFEGWCKGAGVVSLPASAPAVASYLTICADSGLASGSIQRRVSAIAAWHTAAGFDSPTGKAAVKLTLAGIRRKLGTFQEGKTPTLTADICAMVAKIPNTLLGVRDRALLLVGFAGAFRRSELVALNVEDVTFTEDGLKIHIRKSKTDQEGAGQFIGIAHGTALCPVRALKAWLSAATITEGAIFRRVRRYGFVKGRMGDQVVAVTVKTYAEAAGLDPAKYAGHSLRAGLVTQAAINGVPEHAIMRQTRHKSTDMLRKYIREASLFRENASARVGL
jgi:site-specific recombinase XerD